MKQANFPFALKSTALALAMSVLLVGCGGDSKDSNKAPTASNIEFSIQSGTSDTRTIVANDADGDSLTYSISSQPAHGTASITGNSLTYVANNEIATDQMKITISDGKESIEILVNITLQAESVLNYQFYKVTNPETTTSQIVRYDPNNSNPDTNQERIKDDVILGSRVFVISGVKDGDKTRYIKREYGIFHDPSADYETRTATSRRGVTFEYRFYSDHKLKAFDAGNIATERVIFDSSMLGTGLKNAGIKVVDGTTKMFLNEIDIDNSYVQLAAYDKLADLIKKEDPTLNLYVPITVRLSDGAMVQGRTLSVIQDATGATSDVLVNFIAPHVKGSYPTASAERQRLQSCNTALTTCTDIADGNFFLLAENTEHVYLNKEGVDTIFAYNKSTKDISEVTGVTYPAVFTPDHHLITTGGYSSTHLNFFTSLADIKTNLSEGNTSYVAINYDLDTDSPIGKFFGSDFAMFKHAQILKLTNTTGTKVFDNGDGIDHMNSSTGIDTTMSEHISLTAVKDGKLFFELATYTGNADLGGSCIPGRMGDNCSNLRQGWLDTAAGTFPKTDLDKELGKLEGLRFLRGNRIPPVAIGDHIYIAMWDSTSDTSSFSGRKTYNVYKMPFGDLTQSLPSEPTAQGRMFFERTASRSNGIYEGNVLLWDALTSKVSNPTMGITLGYDSDIETEPDTIVNAMAKGSTDIVAGIGGLFGLNMFTGHGGTPYLTAGESEEAGSLRKVNHIKGSWIID
jgi:hypothetical protein